MNRSGFTLIEIVIYLALFTILIGGLMATAQGLWQSAGTTTSKVNTQEEINFVLKKIDWALTGASNITSTSPLKITNHGKTYGFRVNGVAMEFCDTTPCTLGSSYSPITTQNVSVANENFNFNSTTNIVTISFEVDGVAVSLTKYLRF